MEPRPACGARLPLLLHRHLANQFLHALRAVGDHHRIGPNSLALAGGRAIGNEALLVLEEDVQQFRQLLHVSECRLLLSSELALVSFQVPDQGVHRAGALFDGGHILGHLG